jgi:hypothetical protein
VPVEQACQTQTHVRTALSFQRQKSFHSFEKFFKFYCSEALLYDNLSKDYLINIILRFNKIAAGPSGQAMGLHAARRPLV